MKKLSHTLQNRIDRVTAPEPTIVIFKGREYYISDTGQTDDRSRVAVQFSVRFRDKQLRQLKGPILAVFICIALHINEEGRSWPSIALIVKETGYNKDTVLKCLKKLQFMGFISRIQKKDKNTGKFRSNVYQLFPKSRKFKAENHVRFQPLRVSPYTVASVTKNNQI